MRNMLFFAAMLLFTVTSCDSEVNTPNNTDPQESRVTEDVMELLINDLLVGVCSPRDCEVKKGDEYLKRWIEDYEDPMDIPIGSYGAKGGDFGIGNPIVFNNDGTCKIGYVSILYSGCEKTYGEQKDPNHPSGLYYTWLWSYDNKDMTITFTPNEKDKAEKKNVAKIVSYKDGVLLIDGNLPGFKSPQCTYKYKCQITGAEARAEFEEVYYNEEDYPCCAK